MAEQEGGGGKGVYAILIYQLTLSMGADYAHHITTCPLRFSDLPSSQIRMYSKCSQACTKVLKSGGQ